MEKPPKADAQIVLCRTCGKSFIEQTNHPYFPFCSKRCKMVDLNSWFTGDYKISDEILIDEDDSQLDSEPTLE